MNEELPLGKVAPRAHVIRFGPFELDVRSGELRKRGRKILLQEQPFQILLMLLERAGDVVLREEIRQRLWPEDTFVQFAPSINAAIQRLREAMGDSADQPRYVQTVARRGYRLLETVKTAGNGMEGPGGIVASAGSSSLRVAGTRRGNALHSIAVLPFANASSDPNGDFLSEGITENIINGLSKIAELRVTPTSTVFRYRRKAMDPQAIGHELRVGVVLVGRVTQRDATLVVSAELLDVTEGTQLWGERYNRKLADLFEIEQEIAKKISESLRVKLSGKEEERLTKRFTDNSEAYQLYLRGRHWWSRRTPDTLKRGQQYFQQAIEKDAGYALAYSGLADCYSHLCSLGAIPPKEAWAKAKAAAAAAIALDPELAEAHTSMAFVRAFAEWDWENSDREFHLAMKLDAGYWVAPFWQGMTLIARGRYEEAESWIDKAWELEPLSSVIAHGAAFNLFVSRRYHDAINVCLKAIDIAPDYPLLRLHLGIAYEQESRYEEAIAEVEKALQLLGGEPVAAGPLGHVYAEAGRQGEARRILEDLMREVEQRHVDAYSVALVYVALGQTEQAINWLERASEDRCPWFSFMASGDPRVDGLRSDRRFEKLLQRMITA
jgi:TolB-like protein/DNA-binding winged helix-turn-helix (wHTH) protein/Flp pilus assembly protein TadD